MWKNGLVKASQEIGVGLSTPHEMTRTKTLEDGVDEWSCTGCARRLLIRRPPEFQKTVLERGDEWAAHVGSTGSLRVNSIEPRPDDLRAADRSWLGEHGIDWGADGAS